MKCDVFIPARSVSSRLPSKHFLKINEVPVIKHIVNRAKSAQKIKDIIVCTTDLKSDDKLVEYLKKNNILYFRGNNKDILKRFLDASNHFQTDIIIDVSGDKLYTDPYYIDKVVTMMEDLDLDFTIGSRSAKFFETNDHFIHGIIPAGIRKTALKKICDLKKTDDTETGYREFFTRYDFINYKFTTPDKELIYSKNIRLTLDYPEDYQLAKIIFKKLGNDFRLEDIIKLFNKNPELEKITRNLVKKWEREYQEKIADFSLK